jgi:hypothetical protein
VSWLTASLQDGELVSPQAFEQGCDPKGRPLIYLRKSLDTTKERDIETDINSHINYSSSRHNTHVGSEDAYMRTQGLENFGMGPSAGEWNNDVLVNGPGR